MLTQFFTQEMYRPRIVGLHATLRARHGRSSLFHVQTFPGPQQERLLLALGKFFQGALQFAHTLIDFRILVRPLTELVFRRLDWIFIAILVAAEPASVPTPDGVAPMPD